MEAAKYLVLAENEESAGAYAWKDVTGERYHFPNQYINRVVPGRKFVYYSGTRSSGGTRKNPDYFGTGIIGNIYPDPDASSAKKEWLADIADYQPFVNRVPFRSHDGTLTELGSLNPPHPNYWGVGVRGISSERFKQILLAGGMSYGQVTPSSVSGSLTPAVDQIWRTTPYQSQNALGRTYDYRRLSRRAKEIGDEAERLVMDWLLSQATDSGKKNLIRWVAQESETPGYDIEDRCTGVVKAYEVKGTTAGQFLSLALTANEWACANKLRSAYNLVLVTGVFTPSPRFRFINDPVALFKSGVLHIEPLSYQLTLASELPRCNHFDG